VHDTKVSIDTMVQFTRPSRAGQMNFNLPSARDEDMKSLARSIVAFAVATALAPGAPAQSARSLVVPFENEPPPKLTIQPPLPGPLAEGVAFIPYHVDNLRILPIGGESARALSPRVGHVHVTVDDLPWQWADYGQSDTIILVNLPRGEHKVLIEAVDPDGGLLTSQSVRFVAPGK
jgi:hypothetical protein